MDDCRCREDLLPRLEPSSATIRRPEIASLWLWAGGATGDEEYLDTSLVQDLANLESQAWCAEWLPQELRMPVQQAIDEDSFLRVA